ncbi:unnamed protein product [Oppiella nova]|uniref:Cytochrome P450 n=1 Tax=Oppiella nova TaxID=334625 RepID=A0A7R9MCD8_9ACAR|nr:unnamed protein product [Oppiella nova]CAG2173725.1 unnamed protein product [Oppiella nova]
MATSAYGISYDLEDKEFKRLKYILTDYPTEIAHKILLWEFSAFVRFIDSNHIKQYFKNIREFQNNSKQKLISHYSDYSGAIERDFCDALITAKNEALREGKESAPYLTDDNLAMMSCDLFLGGTDTSHVTFRWMILLMTYYPEMQRKLRQEIETQIGDRMPTHEDRNRCHYVMAFIAETMRFRNVTPQGVPHRTVRKLRQEIETQIGDRMPTHEDRNRCHYVMAFIAETMRFRNVTPQGVPHRTVVNSTLVNMEIMTYQGMILRNDKYWDKGFEFIPERFLDSEGRYLTVRPKAYIPFGVGRRVCLGEKLAIADLFLVLVTFLQSTQDCDIVLDSHNEVCYGTTYEVQADNKIELPELTKPTLTNPI